MRTLSPVELIVILAIVLLIFGVGRVSKIGRELGSAISEFRRGLKGGQEEEAEITDEAAEETR